MSSDAADFSTDSSIKHLEAVFAKVQKAMDEGEITQELAVEALDDLKIARSALHDHFVALAHNQYQIGAAIDTNREAHRYAENMVELMEAMSSMSTQEMSDAIARVAESPDQQV